MDVKEWEKKCWDKEDKAFWTRLSVGFCNKCGEPHHLVDGVCWDCRKLLK